MKGMKRKLLQKLGSIPQLGHPEQHTRILRVHASDGVFQSPPPPPLGTPPRPSASSARALRELPVGREQKQGEQHRLREQQQQHGHRDPNHKAASLCEATPPPPEPDIIDVAELMRDLEDEEEEEEDDDLDQVSDKENIRPAPTVASAAATKVDRTHPKPGKGPQPLSSSSPHSGNRGPPRRLCAPPTSEHLDRSPFRRPDPNAASLFDPDLLAAFEQAVIDHACAFQLEYKSRSTAIEQEQEEQEEEREKQLDCGKGIHQEHPSSRLPPTQKAADHNEEQEGNGDSPGGDDAVVFYTTSLRGVRKTFEDCNSVRCLLSSLRVGFRERDVSMHLAFREELWHALGGRTVPPRLFVRGRYVGGADDVLGLHEQGRLLPLLRGLPADRPGGGAPCRGCGGVGFVVCAECSGSRKVLVGEGRRGEPTRCPGCNENGLVVCALCVWPCHHFYSSPAGKQVSSREGILSHISSPFARH